MKEISLSPSKLNLFLESPQCFWDAEAGDCPRPRGIFPSLPGGMDLILKQWADRYRGELPPPLVGRLPGVLWKDDRLTKFRHWKTAPQYHNDAHNVTLRGALDDILSVGEALVPLDWKTKGSMPKDDGSQYYQSQMNCYTLMLTAGGYKTLDMAYLVYVHPSAATLQPKNEASPIINVSFLLTPFCLETNPDKAEETLIKAAECLRGPRPKATVSNEWVEYVNKKIIIANNILKTEDQDGRKETTNNT